MDKVLLRSAGADQLDLEPLLSACRSIDSCSLTFFGSLARLRLQDVSDVDLHLAVDDFDRARATTILAAAAETVRGVAAALGRSWRLELRHGPFKPKPGPDRPVQLHLVIDDTASLECAPVAIALHRLATGRLLVGRTVNVTVPSASGCRLEARRELARWRQALDEREIPFRRWQLGSVPALVDARTPARTAWELSCLLGAACTAADLQYAVALAARDAGARDTGRSLIELVADYRSDWRRLPRRWDDVADKVISVLDRRLDLCNR